MTELAETDNTTTPSPGTDLATLRSLLPEVPERLAEAYPALSPEIDLTEVMDGALGEGKTLRISQLTSVRVPAFDPSGGGNYLAVPDENGVKQARPQGLVGIPVSVDQRRSWWSTSDITNSPPECASRDLIHGVGRFGPGSEENESGECATCPMNARGSAGTGTMAAACKEQRLIFLLTEEEAFPYMVVVPPGSLKEYDKHGAMLVKKLAKGPERPELGINPRTGKTWRASPWLCWEIKVELAQDTNKADVKFNKLKITPTRRLDRDEIEIVGMYGRTIDEMIAANAEMIDEMANAAAADVSGNGASSTATPPGGRGGFDGDPDLGDLEDEVPASSGRK